MLMLRKATLALVLLSVTLFSCSTAATQEAEIKTQNTSKIENTPLAQAVPQNASDQNAPACPTCEAQVQNDCAQNRWPLSEGFGILGDSFYDEYQADDQRGGNYHETTFNLVEILVHTRHFNLGPWGRREEPRRAGYAYNWARSGATSDTMIEQGQHTGLAEQIRAGKVSYVWIGIGANDFSPYYLESYKDIYDGKMTNKQLREKVDRAIDNVTLAVDTVLEAGAKGVVVTYFTQWDLDPQISQRYPDAKGRKRVADAIDAVNKGIQAMADDRQIHTFNQNNIGAKILENLRDNRYLPVGDVRIDFAENGDKPKYSRLGDDQHLGTVVSGFSANWYLIATLNEKFGFNIAPLTEEEILEISGFGE